VRLDGRVALITGGTQGVGAAISKRLAQAGCNLLLHGLRDDSHAATTCEECRQAGVEVKTLFADLAQPPEQCVPQFASRVLAGCPEISILINNAGTCCDVEYLEMNFEAYQRTMHLNVATPYFLTQAIAKRWIASGTPGRVLFTGSINGVLAEPTHTAYDTSKGAVHALVRSLCVSLAPHNIRVNAMAPGLVVTPLTAPAIEGDPEFRQWMELHTPNGRVPDPSSCAAAALFLLSDEAEHIHGQTLLVDGGMSAWQQPDLPDRLRKPG
jgi:NAD(P)-dependent dehydrogenase (short-subunit alcohol dehydrogenase family)